jgi:formylmethanofuran dehydrogenase subunit A
LAIQIPFYYTSKTTVENGKWEMGIGIGLKINNLLTKNKTVK